MGKAERKRLIERPRCRCEDNTKVDRRESGIQIDFMEIGWKDVDRMCLDRDGVT
jgi:hypothetical protein